MLEVSGRPRRQPIPYDEVVPLIEASVAKLGFIPDLFLIHSPWVAEEGKLKELWQQLESLKDQGKLRSIGVSNFRPQDLEAILDGSKYKPVINQVYMRFTEKLKIIKLTSLQSDRVSSLRSGSSATRPRTPCEIRHSHTIIRYLDTNTASSHRRAAEARSRAHLAENI